MTIIPTNMATIQTWLGIQFAIFKHASIEDIQVMLRWDALQEIFQKRSSMRTPASEKIDPSAKYPFWPVLCCCSERKCFSGTDIRLRRRRPKISLLLESLTIQLNEFQLLESMVNIFRRYCFGSSTKERLDVQLIKPALINQALYLSAWDLAGEIISTWGAQALRLRISVISSCILWRLRKRFKICLLLIFFPAFRQIINISCSF